MDEPTTGLHFDDVKKLLAVLHKLVNAGNTLVVVEHNLDMIKSADWVIDLGPEGGTAGGQIMAEGRPEQVAKSEASHTGRFLAQALRSVSRITAVLFFIPEAGRIFRLLLSRPLFVQVLLAEGGDQKREADGDGNEQR